ncbi:hypothetical protein PIROE2DRAFT_11348 [Piromyces sp. E2]|nr:hypothetical protein PIROE2DRAFT_11348 [Piromyces sp. E2]|eukprot:OUM62388.1 hypothetical protein PIROE2DRAFT_11348 [Piromyces sp. E2]
MSENNNNTPHTKGQLDGSNYRLWRQELHLVLTILKLNKYIHQEVVKKVDGSQLSADEKKNMTLVGDSVNIYYAKGTKEKDIVNDATTKEVLMYSIDSKLATNIDFISTTAYEVFNTIKGINVSDDRDRIQELKDSLSNTKYDPNGELSLSIFISNMNIKFKKLENLKVTLAYSDKFDYLYNSIPEELAIKSNLISQTENWENTTKYLINTAQHLKRLQDKREKEEQKVETNFSHSWKNKGKQEIKCRNCGKFGHYKDECEEKRKKGKGKKVQERKGFNNGRRTSMSKQRGRRQDRGSGPLRNCSFRNFTFLNNTL